MGGRKRKAEEEEERPFLRAVEEERGYLIVERETKLSREGAAHQQDGGRDRDDERTYDQRNPTQRLGPDEERLERMRE